MAKGKQKQPQEDESDSDWDSMSEMRPPPVQLPAAGFEEPLRKQEEINSGRSPTHLPPEDYPPHSFRSQVQHPTRLPPVRPPGKENKGNVYDPSYGPQEKLSHRTPFNENSTDSSERDVVESSKDRSRYKEKSKNVKQTGQLRPQDQILASLNRLKNLPKPTKNLKRNSHQGVDNEGFNKYEDEDNPYASYRQEQLHTETEKKMAKEIQKANHTMTMAPVDKTAMLPVQIGIHDTPSSALQFQAVQDSLKGVNATMEKIFNVVAIPFVCFFMFFHHLIRFVLLAIAKPILLDSLSLLSNLFLSPLLKGVLQPLLVLLKLAAESLAEILTSILSPFVQLLKAFRLVEINVDDKSVTSNV